jgi:hypothetical protein
MQFDLTSWKEIHPAFKDTCLVFRRRSKYNAANLVAQLEFLLVSELSLRQV